MGDYEGGKGPWSSKPLLLSGHDPRKVLLSEGSR